MLLNSDRVTAAINSSFNKNRFVDAGTSIVMSRASLGTPMTGDTIQDENYNFAFICGVSYCDGDDAAGV